MVTVKLRSDLQNISDQGQGVSTVCLGISVPILAKIQTKASQKQAYIVLTPFNPILKSKTGVYGGIL